MAQRPRATSSSAALQLKKVGNEIDVAARRPRDPPDQRARRRLLPGAAQARARAARRAARSGRATWRSRRCAGSPASTFPTASATTSSSRCAIPTSTRSTRAGSSRTAASTSPSRDYDAALRGDARRRTRPRCTRGISGRRRLSGRPARALQPQLRPPARRSRRRRRARPGSGRSAATRSRASSCAPSRSLYACDEALRIIDAYEPPDRPVVAVRAARRRRLRRTEAPRGLLYHRYRLDDDGAIARRADRPADLAEPGEHRGGPARLRRRHGSTCRTTSSAIAASRRSATTTRASPAPRTSSTSRRPGLRAMARRGVRDHRHRQPRPRRRRASAGWSPQRLRERAAGGTRGRRA